LAKGAADDHRIDFAGTYNLESFLGLAQASTQILGLIVTGLG
jgi:hypothetical protein